MQWGLLTISSATGDIVSHKHVKLSYTGSDYQSNKVSSASAYSEVLQGVRQEVFHISYCQGLSPGPSAGKPDALLLSHVSPNSRPQYPLCTPIQYLFPESCASYFEKLQQECIALCRKVSWESWGASSLCLCKVLATVDQACQIWEAKESQPWWVAGGRPRRTSKVAVQRQATANHLCLPLALETLWRGIVSKLQLDGIFHHLLSKVSGQTSRGKAQQSVLTTVGDVAFHNNQCIDLLWKNVEREHNNLLWMHGLLKICHPCRMQENFTMTTKHAEKGSSTI